MNARIQTEIVTEGTEPWKEGERGRTMLILLPISVRSSDPTSVFSVTLLKLMPSARGV
jgi:hypothetical protein